MAVKFSFFDLKKARKKGRKKENKGENERESKRCRQRNSLWARVPSVALNALGRTWEKINFFVRLKKYFF